MCLDVIGKVLLNISDVEELTSLLGDMLIVCKATVGDVLGRIVNAGKVEDKSVGKGGCVVDVNNADNDSKFSDEKIVDVGRAEDSSVGLAADLMLLNCDGKLEEGSVGSEVVDANKLEDGSRVVNIDRVEDG